MTAVSWRPQKVVFYILMGNWPEFIYLTWNKKKKKKVLFTGDVVHQPPRKTRIIKKLPEREKWNGFYWKSPKKKTLIVNYCLFAVLLFCWQISLTKKLLVHARHLSRISTKFLSSKISPKTNLIFEISRIFRNHGSVPSFCLHKFHLLLKVIGLWPQSPGELKKLRFTF